MKYRNIGLMLLSIVLGISGCVLNKDADNCSSQDALSVANGFLQKNMPYELDSDHPKPTTKRNGDTWEIQYGEPEGTLGGAPLFIIDKKTCMILKVIAQQ